MQKGCKYDRNENTIKETVARGLPPHADGAEAAAREAAWPLNPTVTKRSVHPQLNATVEMLHFESRPGVHVTAGLWVPAPDAPGKDAAGRRVGILYASGHSCQAWRRRVLQLFAQRASSKATSAPEMLLFHATIASTPSDVGDGYRKVGRDAIQDPDTGLVYQNMSLAASIVTAGVAKGYAVALVSVCGFGEMGSDHTFTKQTSDPMGTYVHGLASFNGRSLPGIHAAEINRTMTFLAERAELSDVAGAVAMNQTDAAALHLAAISSTKQEVRGDSSKGISSKSSRKFLAVVGGVASYELVAATRLYKAPQWMDVPGVLQSYDLPDLAAAAAAAAVVQAGGGGNALIGGIDCVIILQPVATTTYAFASRAAADAGAYFDVTAGNLDASTIVQHIMAAAGPGEAKYDDWWSG
eukprot:gene19635-34464_t